MNLEMPRDDCSNNPHSPRVNQVYPRPSSLHTLQSTSGLVNLPFVKTSSILWGAPRWHPSTWGQGVSVI